MSDELESGDFAQLVVPAWYRPCVHGGGWWETEDVDGRKVLLGSETPTLDAMVAKAREEGEQAGLRKAVEVAKRYDKASGCMDCTDTANILRDIEALIDRTTEGKE